VRRRRTNGSGKCPPLLVSLAVATLLTGLDEKLHILIEDDDVEAEAFMTYGRLLAFAQRKVGG